MAAVPTGLLQVSKTRKRIFHDIEYTIRLITDDNGCGLTVEVSINTGETWKSYFRNDFIEEISRRAGNAKSFPVFLKMLVSALDEDSSSVYVDVLTARDLEMLRQRNEMKPPNTKETSNKRYVILTYQAEFDKVHYPLALQPAEEDSTDSLRAIIIQLRAQIEKGVNTEQIDHLHHENEELRIENEQLRIDLNNAEQRIGEVERHNGSDLRRENVELRHAKQSLLKHQNELKSVRESKQRMMVDHRKELELLRKEVTTNKNEIRRLQTQLRSANAIGRGVSPIGSRIPSPTRMGCPPSRIGSRPGSAASRSGSVRSTGRPLSATGSSTGSDCSRPSSANRPTSSRHARTTPSVPSHRVSPTAQRRVSPANSFNSFNRREGSPRTGLPPQQPGIPSSGRYRDRSPTVLDGRPNSANRRSAGSDRGLPASTVQRPASRRHSPSPTNSDRERGPPRAASRSLSPGAKRYVSPYAQTARPSPTRRGSNGVPLPPGSSYNSIPQPSVHHSASSSDKGSSLYRSMDSRPERSEVRGDRYNERGLDRNEQRGSGLLTKPSSNRLNSPSRSNTYQHQGEQVRVLYDRSSSEMEEQSDRATDPSSSFSRVSPPSQPSHSIPAPHQISGTRSDDDGGVLASSAASTETGCRDRTETTCRERTGLEKAASPVRLRTGGDLAPAVSDIDARLTALQNFLRNNQTMVDT